MRETLTFEITVRAGLRQKTKEEIEIGVDELDGVPKEDWGGYVLDELGGDEQVDQMVDTSCELVEKDDENARFEISVSLGFVHCPSEELEIPLEDLEDHEEDEWPDVVMEEMDGNEVAKTLYAAECKLKE